MDLLSPLNASMQYIKEHIDDGMTLGDVLFALSSWQVVLLYRRNAVVGIYSEAQTARCYDRTAKQRRKGD